MASAAARCSRWSGLSSFIVTHARGPDGPVHGCFAYKGGAESVELIMWLAMRGALTPKVGRIDRGYYNPMTTGVAVLTLEDGE